MGLGSSALVDRYTKSFKCDGHAIAARGAAIVLPEAPTDRNKGSESRQEHDKSLSPSLSQNGECSGTSADLDGQKAPPPPREESSEESAKMPAKTLFLTQAGGSDNITRSPGEVAEWLNAPVSKTG